MIEWFLANGATVIITALIAAILFAVTVYLRREKKKGNGCGCGCSCGGCTGCEKNNQK